MRQPTPQEIEALRRRWRENLRRAQEKAEHPSAADIQAANASNDPVVAELVAETTKALEEHSKRLLSRVKVNGEGFEQASKIRKPNKPQSLFARWRKSII